MNPHTLLPSALHAARWLTGFRALLHRWCRRGRSGDEANLARRHRVCPDLV